MKKLLILIVLCGLSASSALSLSAQTAEAPPAQPYQPLADQELDQLLGPIALYPDPLIAQILPAATLPEQIVLADRYVSGGGDPNQIEQQPWDASIQAVAHYPNVLKWLDDNLAWTTELGQAFLNQQQDVMNSVQRLRATAQNLGNLQSTPQQQIVDDGADIDIVPADPNVIYVPEYDPGMVYVDGGPFITFGAGFAIGGWLNCDFDWGHHHLIVWDHDHPRPHDWWHERGPARAAAFSGHTTVWHPVNHPGVGSRRPVDRGYVNPQVHHDIPHPNPVGNHPATREPQNHDNHGEADHPGTVHVGPVIGQPHPAPAPETHFNTPPVQHGAPATRAPEPSGGAFIGIQSSQDTRNFSNRGQQSMGTIQHSSPAPAPRSAPSGGGAGGGGGGGGGHQKR